MTKALIILTAFIGINATLNVNPTQSTISWEGNKVVGSGHNGTISLKEGTLEMTNGKLTGGSFVIDMTTIACTDLSGDYKGKLEGHLKSDDFFGVANYPSASFIITKAKSKGNGKYAITGDITIKGKTESISFETIVTEEGNNYVAQSDISIDRTKFDVKYGSGSFFDNLGDKAINDEFTLNVKLVASK